jgi:hypothetical protein
MLKDRANGCRSLFFNLQSDFDFVGANGLLSALHHKNYNNPFKLKKSYEVTFLDLSAIIVAIYISVFHEEQSVVNAQGNVTAHIGAG